MSEPRCTVWEALEKFPPYYVRMLAKYGNHAITDAEVAIGSGLPIDRVREIKFLTSWKSVPIGEMAAFFQGCAFDPTSYADRHRVQNYEYVCTKRKVKPFKYLRDSPKWATEFLPLLKLLSSPRQSSAA